MTPRGFRVVKPPGVEQAGIAAHLRPLKAAGDAGRIVVDVGRALQNSPLGKVNLQIAVQLQRPGQVVTRRKIQDVIGAAVVDGSLQVVGVQRFAVALAEIGRSRYVDAAFFFAELQRLDPDAIAATGDFQPVSASVGQALDGEMCFIRAADDLAVQRDGILRPFGRSGGFIPIEHCVIFGAAQF